MGLFDKLKGQVGQAGQAVQGFSQAAQSVAGRGGNKSVSVVFSSMPENQAELAALPQAAMKTPFDTAALVAAALCVHPLNPAESIRMLNFLKGPQPLSQYDVQFIAERLRGKAYLPMSFFSGATYQNNYTPAQPYTVIVSENPYSYQEQGYAKMFLQSGGADSPRPVQLRQAKDGKWYLWEQFLLSDIRQPADLNPWA